MSKLARRYVPNAILFVYDPANKQVEVPEYEDGDTVSFTDTCISVGTQADVDGEVSIALEHFSPVCQELYLIHSGLIRTPHGNISVLTSEGEQIVTRKTNARMVKIRVYVDHASPGYVHFEIDRE